MVLHIRGPEARGNEIFGVHMRYSGTTEEQAYDRGYQFDLIRGLWTGGFGIGFIIEKVSFLNWSNNNF